MILGIGVDLLEVPRMRRAVERGGERFVRRVFTDAEADHCRRRGSPDQSFAARFAAKEAVMKALGTGWSRGVTWRDIEVVKEPGRAPRLELGGRAAALARARGVTRTHLTLSHIASLVAAVVVLEGDGSP